jgi:hypothetical protein
MDFAEANTPSLSTLCKQELERSNQKDVDWQKILYDDKKENE